MPAKAWFAIIAEAFVFAILLFGAAGTLRWPAGWAFLVLFFAFAFYITSMLARDDPSLLNERLKMLVQKDQPLWDQILMCALVLIFIGWLVLMGLDAVRFRWSIMAVWVQCAGAVCFAASMWFSSLAFKENTFLAPVVQIQVDRGHKVVSTGPYAIVRHPLYAGALLFLPSTALLLGSWYGLGVTVLLAGLLVLRTALEDRELQRGLHGYSDYCRRARYRLIPGIW